MPSIKTINQLKRHEGLKLVLYKCSKGKLTIGYGRCLETNPLSSAEADYIGTEMPERITEEQAEYLLANDIAYIKNKLEFELPIIKELCEARRAVLINMAFNVGVGGLMKFKKMLAHLKRHDYFNAALEMHDSQWRRDVGTRATELMFQMQSGKFVELK